MGRDGDDSLMGNDGGDYLYGGTGIDTLQGGAGDDSVDVTYDGLVGDIFAGGDGTDDLTLIGSAATGDIVWIHDPAQISGFEKLFFYAGKGNDLIDVGEGPSGSIYGGSGNDTLIGGALADRLLGEAGSNSLTGKGGNDELQGGSGSDTLIGGAGADSLRGERGADLFVCGDPSAADYVGDFSRVTDKLAIAQSAYAVGDGDSAVEGAITIGGPGGFAASAELVVNTKDIGNPFSAEKAATAMGSATSAYALGQTAIFVLDDGSKTAIYGFESAGTDAVISAAELTLLCKMDARGGTVVGDYLFVG
jgi:Ca2+-binding RTX toxin-like protein